MALGAREDLLYGGGEKLKCSCKSETEIANTNTIYSVDL